MIRWKSPFLFCDSESAKFLKFTDQKIAVWLHVESLDDLELSPLITSLINAGAVHFAVSGKNPVVIHDKIDDVLLGLNDVDIVTTWHEEALNEVAWDFANVEFVSGEITIRCLVVVGDSTNVEISLIEKLANLIRLNTA